mgnify:CR=1 FL=1
MVQVKIVPLLTHLKSYENKIGMKLSHLWKFKKVLKSTNKDYKNAENI